MDKAAIVEAVARRAAEWPGGMAEKWAAVRSKGVFLDDIVGKTRTWKKRHG